MKRLVVRNLSLAVALDTNENAFSLAAKANSSINENSAIALFGFQYIVQGEPSHSPDTLVPEFFLGYPKVFLWSTTISHSDF
jgi:hypothetical protein